MCDGRLAVFFYASNTSPLFTCIIPSLEIIGKNKYTLFIFFTSYIINIISYKKKHLIAKHALDPRSQKSNDN